MTRPVRGRWVFDEPAAPVVASVPVQVNLPTSAYGQTIPVVYGKCRLPSAYIWVPPILTVTETHQESGFWGIIHSTTSTTTNMSARLRFARPLVPNSPWSLRKFYANGNLVFDGTTGYRQDGLQFIAYDGRSTQGRDPTMVDEEGEDNVSAHRGYLDIVIKDFDISGLGAPPVFEAEWIQDGAAGTDIDVFQTFTSDAINTFAGMDWESGSFYGYSSSSTEIRRFSIAFTREIYAVEINGLGRSYFGFAENIFRYIPEFDRIVAVGNDSNVLTGGSFPLLLNPLTGASVAEASGAIGSPGQFVNTASCFLIGASGILAASAYNAGNMSIYLFTANSITRVSRSGSNWDGKGRPECFTPGEIRGANADLWVCAGSSLYKCVVTSTGLIQSTLEHAVFVDDPLYVVWHDNDLIVWTDNLQVIRIDGATGAVVWTKAVAYQISAGVTRTIPTPDALRIASEFFYETTGQYYFTNLDTGETRSVTKASPLVFRSVFDGLTNTVITTDNVTEPFRTVFDASGDGTDRDLSDFLHALMEDGGGFDPSEVQTINIDDVIEGAVIDVTAGCRDIARATCEPYSIAIFERSGVVIFKRALTDASFAVDVSVSSAGDITDSGGQGIKARRLNPEEFVSRYGINFRDPAEIYQARAQYGEIPTLPLPVATADQAVKADIPIIVDADTIKVLATQRVNRMALERHELSMTLRAKYLDLEPEDIEQFTFSNRIITARITETTTRPDYMIDVKATEFLSSVSVSITGATGRPIEPTPVGTPASRYYHMDIPLLSDGDDLAGAGFTQYHVLASAGQPYWDGATLYRKDATGTYQPVAGQTTNGIVGIALEALPDWDIPYVTEFTRTLDIAIISGDASLMETVTYLEMMNGANYFAIGQPGRWEVCQVMTITTNANGSYTFEGLRRGAKSSEEYTALHAKGDFVVWLSEDNVQRIDYAIAALDDAFDFKPVGFGGNISTTAAVNRTVTGEAEKIPKPCHLDASIDSPSDVRLSWVRRSRIGAYWSDDGEDAYTAPLGETLEQYVVRIKDGPGGNVLRTVTVNNATLYDYSGALQTTDFGSPLTSGDDLTFDIRQVSGTGVICPTREATITL